jgi:hypothetical protein
MYKYEENFRIDLQCGISGLGRVPKQEEIEQVFLLARVMYKAILGLHFKRQEQKKFGQLAIF